MYFTFQFVKMEYWVLELDEKVKWFDWVGQFSDKINNLRDVIEPKERRTFLDVRKYLFRKLICNNGESKGYELVNGQFNHLVNTTLLQSKGRKTEIEIVSEHVTSAKKV